MPTINSTDRLLDLIQSRFARMNARLDDVERRLDSIVLRLAWLEQRVAEIPPKAAGTIIDDLEESISRLESRFGRPGE